MLSKTARILARPYRLKAKTLKELTEARLKARFVGNKGRYHILTTPEAFLETNNDFFERTGKAIEIIGKAAKGNVIAISHGDVITVMLESVVERRVSTERHYLHPDPANIQHRRNQE